MAATFNLVRNTRVFFTTNVNATTGIIPSSGATISNTNTFELQVLDGFNFTQGTQQTTIQINEAGNTPVRGQRAFNTQLDPVEFSFSTYIRPFGTSTVSAEEQVLWNALLTDAAIDAGLTVGTVSAFTRASTLTNVATFTCAAVDLTAAGIASGDTITVSTITGTFGQDWNNAAVLTITAGSGTAATGISLAYLTAPVAGAGTAPSVAPTSLKLHKGSWVPQAATTGYAASALAHTGTSNKNQLQKFGLYFKVDGALYAVDNCCLDTATVDFGLDGIATVAWTGKGTALRHLASATVSSANPGVFSGSGNATGTAAAKNTAANYITNKLSTMTLIDGILGGGGNGSYTIALTGGNIAISNNVNYVVPANLGVVNQAIGYFTGSRSISGNVTAYLRVGSGATAELLSDMLTANSAETKFKLQIEIGGASNGVHVDMLMNGCVLQIPTVETADVMSTTINFTAQGYDPLLATNEYDLSQTNDLSIRYYSV